MQPPGVFAKTCSGGGAEPRQRSANCSSSTSTACSPTAASTTVPTAREYKAFHTRDGSAMKALMAAGIPIAIITGRMSTGRGTGAPGSLACRTCSPVSTTRPRRWNRSANGAASKRTHMAHAGDDLADLALFERTGMAFAVPDAHPAVLARAGLRGLRLPADPARYAKSAIFILVAQGKWTLPSSS